MTLARAKRKHRKQKRKLEKVDDNVTVGLLNKSKCCSDDEIWLAVRHVVPPLKLEQHPYVELTVTSTKATTNWAHSGYYHRKRTMKDEAKVVAQVNTNDNFYYPCKHIPYADGKLRRWGYQTELLLDKMENLVAILAHEFKHASQHEHRKEPNDKPYGVRKDSYRETQAETYAIERTRAWRRLYNHKQAYYYYLPPLFFLR